MAWSYRRRIKIIPGVHLNFSKSGISTSIGIKGSNITFGKKGTYINTGIPTLGIYNRQKLLDQKKNLPSPPTPGQSDDNIFSTDIQEITSQNMQGIKEAILMSAQQRKELKNDQLKIRGTIRNSRLKLAASYIFLYGLIKKSIPQNIRTDIKNQQEATSQLQIQIENCYVKLETEFEIEISEKYKTLFCTFTQLILSNRIWDVTSAFYQDRVAARSSANTLLKKREVKFAIKSLPDIKSNFQALYFQNANGADLYIYPGFIVMYSSESNFALIGIDEVDFSHGFVRFTETESVPGDSIIIDQTWLKVNKNGSPDRRFKGNYQIPIVKYGKIRLQTTTGLNEEYQFSNYDFTAQFGHAFSAYQSVIRSIKQS